MKVAGFLPALALLLAPPSARSGDPVAQLKSIASELVPKWPKPTPAPRKPMGELMRNATPEPVDLGTDTPTNVHYDVVKTVSLVRPIVGYIDYDEVTRYPARPAKTESFTTKWRFVFGWDGARWQFIKVVNRDSGNEIAAERVWRHPAWSVFLRPYR